MTDWSHGHYENTMKTDGNPQRAELSKYFNSTLLRENDFLRFQLLYIQMIFIQFLESPSKSLIVYTAANAVQWCICVTDVNAERDNFQGVVQEYSTVQTNFLHVNVDAQIDTVFL